jgi:hypothetical protein
VKEGKRNHLVHGRKLHVQRRRHVPNDTADVIVGDVPAIFAQMSGDPVGARGHGQMSRPHRIGMHTPTGVPHRGYVINVDAQAQAFCHGSHFLSHSCRADQP